MRVCAAAALVSIYRFRHIARIHRPVRRVPRRNPRTGARFARALRPAQSDPGSVYPRTANPPTPTPTPTPSAATIHRRWPAREGGTRGTNPSPRPPPPARETTERLCRRHGEEETLVHSPWIGGGNRNAPPERRDRIPLRSPAPAPSSSSFEASQSQSQSQRRRLPPPQNNRPRLSVAREVCPIRRRGPASGRPRSHGVTRSLQRSSHADAESSSASASASSPSDPGSVEAGRRRRPPAPPPPETLRLIRFTCSRFVVVVVFGFELPEPPPPFSSRNDDGSSRST
mmetsp:Transcript_38229/g.114402  ORF Transcript_38229/g.114402 Transcript_38229/m.114402 type:complete len:285 (-) Transcript_38229:6-860(-)